ncbi:Hcp family type VI secretion system effector [Kumtagia ephedrae]|jgi:type VI secretion system secreted protein Hcp|uniref:Type VI secretion system tube protein Hcp n=1 Tax=Kumtagia ephedrae TaxID=2116701 RepID=A0A2P7S3I6_9HYPH|nr:type VI secretion system tube protein Hcp [Mesorhizobium ephedrae]PSJ57001.1 type VI secretion system tube protein Hcp [Mesorhizobium ephedrae]
MAQDMFIKIGTLKGEAQDDQFPAWVDVLAWSLGGAQSGTAHQGGGMGGGKVSLQDFSFTKYTDVLSPKIWGHMCDGKHFPTVEFKARKAGGKPFVYLEIKMEDAIVTSVSTGGSGGEDRTTENVTFNFKKYTIKYNQQSKRGDLEVSDEYWYDMAKSKGSMA